MTIYQPLESGSELTGGLVFLHGGGFMAGTPGQSTFEIPQTHKSVKCWHFYKCSKNEKKMN